jgi:hypothetical protein
MSKSADGGIRGLSSLSKIGNREIDNQFTQQSAEPGNYSS